MSKIKDLLWAISSLFELYDRYRCPVLFQVLVGLEQKDLQYLQQQINQKADAVDASVDFLFQPPLLTIRLFQDENKGLPDIQFC